MLEDDWPCVCPVGDTSEERAQTAYSAANRVMFQTGLYCFAQDDIISYVQEKEIEERIRPNNTRERD